MSNFTKSTNWTSTVTQETRESTYIIPVGKKYVDRDITLKISAKNLPSNGITIENKSEELSSTNATLSDSNLSGISIVGTCSGGKVTTNASGWVEQNSVIVPSAETSETKYLNGVSLVSDSSKKFTINDGIYEWTFIRDSSGNVTIY